MGACSSGRSAPKPVELATMASSQRSATTRCGSADAAFARAATSSATLPRAERPKRAKLRCVDHDAVVLEPPARGIEDEVALAGLAGGDDRRSPAPRPSSRARSAGSAGRRRLGVTTSPFSAARAASPGPTTTSASLLTMTTWRPDSIASTAWRTAASGWPVASTTTSIGRSSTTARSLAAMWSPAAQAERASAAVLQMRTRRASMPTSRKTRAAVCASTSMATRALMRGTRRA